MKYIWIFSILLIFSIFLLIASNGPKDQDFGVDIQNKVQNSTLTVPSSKQVIHKNPTTPRGNLKTLGEAVKKIITNGSDSKSFKPLDKPVNMYCGLTDKLVEMRRLVTVTIKETTLLRNEEAKFRARINNIRWCYEKQLIRSKNIEGIFQVHFFKKTKVSVSSFVEAPGFDNQFKNCIQRILKGIKQTPTKGRISFKLRKS